MKGANKKAGGYGKAGISSPTEACSLGAVHVPAQVTQAEIARRQAVAVLLDNKRSSGSHQPKQCKDCLYFFHFLAQVFVSTDRP